MDNSLTVIPNSTNSPLPRIEAACSLIIFCSLQDQSIRSISRAMFFPNAQEQCRCGFNVMRWFRFTSTRGHISACQLYICPLFYSSVLSLLLSLQGSEFCIGTICLKLLYSRTFQCLVLIKIIFLGIHLLEY